MKIRYKAARHDIRDCSKLNMSALNEVLTGDDSAYFHDLECFLESKQEWKCLREAFRDKDVITDNYNEWFAEAKTQEDKDRGYFE